MGAGKVCLLKLLNIFALFLQHRALKFLSNGTPSFTAVAKELLSQHLPLSLAL
jgi:hypothetical protein